MAEAVRRVKEELGPDAVVLHARTADIRTWWGGRRPRVELTAGLAAGPVGASHAGIERELADLRSAVERLRRREDGAAGSPEPEGCRELRAALLEQGLPEALVDRLLQRAAENRGPSGRAGLREAVLNLLERMLPTSGPVRVSAGRCVRVALVGPTGVGKTTTIAKLAARIALSERRSVGLLAADTYRIAAVDQLRRYAEILGAPVRVARTADEVAHAASSLSSHDIVFIDTAGRGHRDELRMNELRRFLEAARPDEVHLVLSLNSETSALFAAVDRFAPLGATRVLFTKLDEAVRVGSLLQGASRARLPVSYVTTGQEVPDDILLPDSRQLARLVLDGPLASGLLRGRDEREVVRRSA